MFPRGTLLFLHRKIRRDVPFGRALRARVALGSLVAAYADVKLTEGRWNKRMRYIGAGIAGLALRAGGLARWRC